MGKALARSALISPTARPCTSVSGKELTDEGVDECGRPGAGLHHVADAARVPFQHVPAHDHLELQPEQLVEGQATPGPLLFRKGLRGVDGPERLGAAHEVELGEPRGRQGVEECPGAPQRLLDPLAELPTGDPRLLRGRVDGHDAPRAVPDQVDHGVGELALAPVRVEFAEEQCLGAHGQLARPPRLVEERHPQGSGAVVDVELDQGPTLAGAPCPHRVDARHHQGLLTHAHAGYVGLPGPVDIAPWVVGDEIEDVEDVDGRQRLGALVADLVDPLDGDLGQAGEHPPAGLILGGRVLRSAHSMLMRNGYSGCPPWWTSTATSGRCSASHSVTRRVSPAPEPSPSINVTSS